jgi:hypothetical protein
LAGILDPTYGAADERRSRTVKRIAIWGLAGLAIVVALFLWLRNWKQEQTVKQFFALLDQKKYQDAYAMWGCTPDHPCKYYSPEAFNEDWGPSSPFSNISAIRILHEDNCSGGVVFNLQNPQDKQVGLFVDHDNILGFAAGPRCPGPHLQIFEFFRSRLG